MIDNNKSCSHGCHSHDVTQGRYPVPPPPPPPHPPHHPYVCDRHDHCGGCSHVNPPEQKPYPSSGKMVGNTFMLIDSIPYLYDNIQTVYGQKLCVGETIDTRISNHSEASCILMAAVFNMTNGVMKNTVLNHYLEQTIINLGDELNGVLPIMGKNIRFTVYYEILDSTGGIVHESSKSVTSQELRFHGTDIDDYFLQSCKNIFTLNIPQLDYAGLYTLKLKYISASVSVFNTAEHITNQMNPFYQFIDNNTKIIIQHDKLAEQATFDSEVIIAGTEIDYSVMFRANVTTRLKLSFTAYMSTLITTQNTFGIWESLCSGSGSDDPDDETYDEVLEQMQTELEQMKGIVDKLTTEVDQAQKQIDNLVDGKVDKVDGKGLSTNDYTDEDQQLLKTLSLDGQIVFKSHLEFPNVGVSNILYVATDERCSYLWDEALAIYVPIDSSKGLDEGDEIQCVL